MLVYLMINNQIIREKSMRINNFNLLMMIKLTSLFQFRKNNTKNICQVIILDKRKGLVLEKSDVYN